ncbi:PL29 family lyase N-terminal domain-containing protein [uncultured Phocaeicola sp.]|uniref:PL29 family lyase N-terminal domain-containing protein n=5 Tax=uncultured Phocaeicola sp. TaxID=990718 RepID=UPI0025A06DDD|nr:PL29 family lyase N-terminal domain-containing protein [uncultured Phocaeicola sp.]
MNKKFLSAILFGALMVSSTGTFVSCKDYDDDIKDLQEQINSNKDAIAALQKLVGEGKWVTNISSIENGFTVTMSDGTTTSITGIKGADGKNGTEWTIGEDGFWYKDGEKTASQAVGEDGKAGVTAPSPKIDANGMWVVYEWDAAKGEFVEKTTEIPAQGTSAYVVVKDGVYVLHIADETGKFQDITLPATSDAFVVEAAAAKVNVKFETAKWTEWNATKDESKALLKAFPGIADIKKNETVKQGGNLPLIVTPATVELTDNFSYSLLDVKGKVADIIVSTPSKGLPEGTTFVDGAMQTRVAGANDCLWTLKVEPAFDAVKKTYAEVEDASLLVENAKGTVVRTAFAYQVYSDDINSDVTITPASPASAKYAETIDVFEKPSDTEEAMFTLANQYDGYFILEATNAVQVEKYGLSIEGSKLTIAKMPSSDLSISVTLKLTALGLNGSAVSKEATFTISQGVEATGELADKSVTLAAKPEDAALRWNIADLGLSAVQLDNFLNGDGANVKLTATRYDADTETKKVAYNAAVTFYNAKGKETTYTSADSKWNNGDAVTFGFDLDATAESAALIGYTVEKFLPKEYVLTLTSTNGNTVIFSAEATLTVSNPTTAIKLNPAFVENGILQITGGKSIATDDEVNYTLTEGIIIDKTYITGDISSVTFKDLDNANYVEEGGSDNTHFAFPNWIETSPKLKANKWDDDEEVTDAEQQMYKVRKVRATYPLFGNTDNTVDFDFEVIVKSEVYSEDASKAIVMNEDKLSAVYGGKDKTNQIDITKAIKSNVFVAGSDKGKTYNLFAVKGGDIKVNGYQYGTIPSVASADGKLKFAVDANDMMIEIAVADMKAFGFKSDAILKAQQGTAKYYLLAANTAADGDADSKEYVGVKTLAEIWTDNDDVLNKYYVKAADHDDYYVRKYEDNAPVKVADDDKAIYDLFTTYAGKVNFAVVKDIKVGETAATEANAKIKAVYLKVVDPEYAKVLIKDVENFDGTQNVNEFVGSTIITAVDELSEGVTESAPVEMQLIVVDAWNKTMTVPFTITLKTK